MADKSDKPATAKFVMDRFVYHMPGKPPHPIGSEQEFVIDDVAHLVAAGHMHRVGAAASPTAASAQLINQAPANSSVPPPPPPPAAPMNYPSKDATAS